MTLTVLLSPGGAPGVTTTALALALCWPRPVVVAECDPSGGSILPGLWGGTVNPDGRGLLYLALDVLQSTPDEAVRQHLLPLDGEDQRHVLPGLSDPAQSRQLAPVWPDITAGLTGLGTDVIADTGRHDAGTELDALLSAADRIVMILRPTVRQAVAARPRLATLAPHLVPVGLITIGKSPSGSDGPRLVADALATSLLAELPDDPLAARVLSDGAPPARTFTRSPLLRAAAAATRILAAAPARTLAEALR